MFRNRLTTLFLKLTAAIAVTVSPAVAGPPVFEDGFDKQFLDSAWEIRNDGEDMRGLDDGRLAVVAQPGTLTKDTVRNFLVLQDPLTEKNADVDLKLRVDIQRYGGDWGARAYGGIALHQDKNRYLILYITNFKAGYKSDSGPYAIFAKRQGGKTKPWLGKRLAAMKTGPIDFHLKIEKRSYKYTARASLDGRKWTRIGTMALLNTPLKPGLFASRGANADEVIYEFDHFSISKTD